MGVAAFGYLTLQTKMIGQGPVKKLETIYSEGRRAFAEGIASRDNPYHEHQHGEPWEWAFGFADAQADEIRTMRRLVEIINDDNTPEQMETMSKKFADVENRHDILAKHVADIEDRFGDVGQLQDIVSEIARRQEAAALLSEGKLLDLEQCLDKEHNARQDICARLAYLEANPTLPENQATDTPDTVALRSSMRGETTITAKAVSAPNRSHESKPSAEELQDMAPDLPDQYGRVRAPEPQQEQVLQPKADIVQGAKAMTVPLAVEQTIPEDITYTDAEIPDPGVERAKARFQEQIIPEDMSRTRPAMSEPALPDGQRLELEIEMDRRRRAWLAGANKISNEPLPAANEEEDLTDEQRKAFQQDLRKVHDHE